jgi:hypothetical protein
MDDMKDPYESIYGPSYVKGKADTLEQFSKTLDVVVAMRPLFYMPPTVPTVGPNRGESGAATCFKCREDYQEGGCDLDGCPHKETDDE